MNDVTAFRAFFLILIVLAIPSQSYGAIKWFNRLGNQNCSPSLYYEPKNLQELCDSIKMSVSHKYRLKAIGNGFSISDIGLTDGCLLNLKNLNHILSIDIEKKLVRVEAGITLQELNEQLAIYGLSLSNQPAMGQITLGGALSTGVHGTGPTSTFSSFITEIELITADGRIHKFSENLDPDEFAASILSLGSFGIIYAATIQCEPLFYLAASQRIEKIENIFKTFEILRNSEDFFQCSWNVATGDIILNHWRRVTSQESGVEAYKALTWYMLNEEDKDLFSEIAVPIKALPTVLKEIKLLNQKYIKLGTQIDNITIRFVEKDKAFLSPASQGAVAYIAFNILEKGKYLEFYEAIENALIAYGGRPHWGKLNFLNYKTANELYGKNLQKFIHVKNMLDPSNAFSNDFTNRVLME